METSTKRKKTFYEKFWKRFFDIVLSFLAIIILSPLMLIVWICSKIFLGGKAILVQYRPGRGGKVFRFIKFRSMTNKTDEHGNLLPDEQRMTKFGKVIRKTSLDELPQLFNILRGDMSFVGPRPRLVKDMIFYDKDVLPAYDVRPGLTGASQVAGGRSEASWESIFEKDLSYSKHVTFWGDVKILFQTVGAVFKSESAADGAEHAKREYFYADYLLKTGKITKAQYDAGLAKANEIIQNRGTITFDESLHNDVTKSNFETA